MPRAHGGTVEKFIGDAVMAVFGVPTVHEDDALRALRAAAELRDSLASLNDELERDYGVSLQLRTGVNTGEVVTGTEERLATGDAVNVAARLEQAAQPGEILIGEQTLRPGARGDRSRASRAALAQGEGGVRRCIPPAAGGRGCTRLRPAARRTARRAARRARAAARGVRPRRLRATLPARHRARAAGDRQVAACPRAGVDAGRRGERPFRSLPPLRRGHHLLAARRDLPARPRPRTSSPPRSPQERRRTIFWSVRKALERRARERPLALVIEDIHWAEPTLLDLLEHLVDWTRDAPLLLLCLARPDLIDEPPDVGRAAECRDDHARAALAEAESDELIEELLGATRSSSRRIPVPDQRGR